MKKIITALLITLALTASMIGCSGPRAAQNLNPPGPPDLSGNWEIILSQNQAARFTSTIGHTELAFTLNSAATQTTGVPPLIFDPACGPNNTANGAFWWITGWNSAALNPTGSRISLTTGLVAAQAITLTFTELADGTASGQLILSGTLRSDGTADGTYSDSCTPGTFSPATWFMKRIAALPTPGSQNP